MLDFLRWNQAKLDAAPGTLVYAGQARDFTPDIVHYAYDADSFVDSRLDSGADISLDEDRVNLLIVTGIHHPEFVKEVGNTLNLSSLCLEDVLNTGQRSKFIWADDDTGFIAVKTMDVDGEQLIHGQISLFWRQNLVVVFQEEENGLLSGVLNRVRKGKGKARRADSTYLLTAILDAVVDHHMLALSNLSEAAQQLETELESTISDELLGELYGLKRESILLRNALLPVREMFKGLLMEDAGISDDALPYLRDVTGHHEQTLEGVTSLHDIMKSMIDYQISLIGIRTNKVMQLLTVIATIFIPLTFIAGVYGMNFKNMPELEWEYGYFVIMGGMLLVALGMGLYFYRKRLL